MNSRNELARMKKDIGNVQRTSPSAGPSLDSIEGPADAEVGIAYCDWLASPQNATTAMT